MSTLNVVILNRLILRRSTREEIDAALRSIRLQEQLEAVWRLSEIQPQAGRCVLNFYGPPGTGKSRAALGVAWKLGQPPYQVDYSAIVSKFLGDTAKHIVQAFREAREQDAVLFFDEADSLLSRRVGIGESCATSINQNRNTLEPDETMRRGLVATDFWLGQGECEGASPFPFFVRLPCRNSTGSGAW